MRRRSTASRSGIGLSVAVGVHGVAALVLLSVDARALFARQQQIIEMDVQEQTPPPPPVEEKKPEPEEKKPEPRPRVVAMQRPPVPRPTPRPVPPEPPAPPPPNQTPPPEAEPAQNVAPVFGVTTNSVVADGPGIAVPIGNTLMTKDRTREKASEVKPYASQGTAPFVPVSDVYIAKMPERLNDVTDPDAYPAEARRMGIEGKVKLVLNLNDKGEVIGVKVVEPAGHGFDEEAMRQCRQLRFSPARTSDGRAVPYRLTYTFRFELPQ